MYQTTYLHPQQPCLLKYRPPKPYRHPTLDARLTKHRCLSEARLLVRARSLGIAVPAVYFVDEARGEIWMEWVAGQSVRDTLDGMLLEKRDADVARLMRSLGELVGALHAVDVVHGDLTTSNVMVRPVRSEPGLMSGYGSEEAGKDAEREDGEADREEVVLIDFGLGAQSSQEEDKAVDLYVLERAFLSTHPKATGLFADVLRAYEGSSKGAKSVLRRLQDVRLRGRKRTMIG